MSTSIVHQPDTPVSSRSPSSIGNNDAGDSSKLDCFHKNDERLKHHDGTEGSCCSSPPMNEDRDCHSGSSSPESSRITPNLSFTPPANGILTPPNDSELGNESLKTNKGAGRLKFYKDGVLCLELSHNDEGAKRKWVQIRTKTVFPTVVHTKKEVIIPRHVSPSPSFHSHLSVTNSLHQRLESSASHSTSDDGSSMLSSPRIRESSWRKPVPHKDISVCLEFYLKPGRCILKYRQNSKNFYHSKRYRKPYCRTRNENTIPYSHFKCSCDISPLPGTAEKTEPETPEDMDMVDSSDNCKSKLGTVCDPVSITENEKKKISTKPSKSTILELVQKLHDENEKHLKLASNQNKLHQRMQETNCKRSSAIPSDQSLLPKKRSFRDTEVKDTSSLSTSSIRPKVSPKSKSVKTILNIPGFNNELSKRSTANSEIHKEIEKPTSQFGPSSIHDNGKNTKHGEVSVTRKKSSANRPLSQQHGPSATDYTTCSPLVKLPRNSPSSPKHSPNNLSKFPSQSQSAMYLSSLPPEQQQIFQQQTMSKAISYTINSLLSSNNQEPSRNSSSVEKIIKNHEKAKISKRDIGGGLGGSNQLPQNSNYFGIKGDHDQNSFLRHLLDTSDPIPQASGKIELSQVTSNNSSNKQPHQESDAYLQQHDSRKSSLKDNNNSKSINRKLLKESKSGKEKVSQPGRSVPPPQQQPVLPPQFQHQLQQMGFYPPSAAAFLQHPGLFGAGFPLGHLQGYESLFGGQNSSVNVNNALAAAAAAAELQYQSLLPPNFLSMNPQMAAAMAASYIGASQPGYPPPPLSSTSVSSNPMASRSSQSPITSRGGRSENVPSSNCQLSSKGSPLSLSHREREGSTSRFHNGIIPAHTSIPVPFHAPTSDSQHSRSRSGSDSSRGRFLAKSANDIVYDDVPLNLSKK